MKSQESLNKITQYWLVLSLIKYIDHQIWMLQMCVFVFMSWRCFPLTDTEDGAAARQEISSLLSGLSLCFVQRLQNITAFFHLSIQSKSESDRQQSADYNQHSQSDVSVIKACPCLCHMITRLRKSAFIGLCQRTAGEWRVLSNPYVHHE